MPDERLRPHQGPCEAETLAGSLTSQTTTPVPPSAQSKARAQSPADRSQESLLHNPAKLLETLLQLRTEGPESSGKERQRARRRNAELGDQQVLSVVTPTGGRRGLRSVSNTSVGEPGPRGLRPCNKALGPQRRKSEEQTPPDPSHPPPSPLGFHSFVLYVCISLSACTPL